MGLLLHGGAACSRVLVIDDEEAIRAGLSRALAAEGLAVELAENGSEGLRRALAGAFDLVILDLLMPRTDGQCCGNSGDQPFIRPMVTRFRSSGSASILRAFGRLRDSRASASAFHARYAARPPCRLISLETTDSLRPIAAAMSLFSSTFARPREMSSLSSSVSGLRSDATLSPAVSRVARAFHDRKIISGNARSGR